MAPAPVPVRLSHDAKLWEWPLQTHDDGVVRVLDTRNFFEVTLDAAEFRPEEVDVKTVGDEVVIHMKHEKRGDPVGSVAREFTRAYHLPKDTDMASVKSSLFRGRLTITANKIRH